ncbi:hypothetical protein CH362_18755 [Leptospira saintgironsiae]|uniref:Uncharacterized protein n=1 Tax=Leptospira saintgironsiae TaxID=2023183 RepID=A0A2M9Y7I2_9LEPT|nr:hypothetical protein CH362_18755 [Leptospira saintgironsiae]
MLRTFAWPSAHFALSLVLLSKPRAKSFGLAKRRQALVVRRNDANIFSFKVIFFFDFRSIKICLYLLYILKIWMKK